VSWANGLAKMGHDVSILADLQTGTMYPVSSQVKLLQLYHSKYTNFVVWRLRKLFHLTLQIRELCKKNNYDAIVSVMHIGWAELKIATCFMKKRPIVVMSDHDACERPIGCDMLFDEKLKKFVWSRLFNCITVLTKADLAVMQRKGVANAVVLYNPLFLTPSTRSIQYKKKYVLAVGRLDAWHYKGFDLLIYAWNRVTIKHPDWKLRIVGKGSKGTLVMLKSLCETPDSIEFLPFRPNPAAIYEESSIFVLSSRYEGWGLVVCEAMSQGCATIACNYKGRQAEIITDGENGLLCEVANADAIAEKIELLIEDEELRKRIQQAAPSSVERFTEDKVASNLVDIIKSVDYV
jgi:glycosyltransferase involved in cell wall biosynthesis